MTAKAKTWRTVTFHGGPLDGKTRNFPKHPHIADKDLCKRSCIRHGDHRYKYETPTKAVYVGQASVK